MTLNIKTLTKEQLEMKENWYTFSISPKWKLVITEPEIINDFVVQKRLENMGIEDLIISDLDFTNLWIKWEQLGKLLSNKFFGWNIYKELQLHRVILQKLLKVVVKEEALTAEDIEIIESLETMDNQAELVLEKFRAV